MPFLSGASLLPLQVTLMLPCHLMSGPFVSQPPFPISGLGGLGVKLRLSWRAFASTHPLMLFPASREFFFACPCFLHGTSHPLLWSPLFPPHAPDLIPLSFQNVALTHLDSLPHHDPVTWTDGSVPFSFWQGRLWRFCELLPMWHRGHSFFFGRPNMFKFFR